MATIDETGLQIDTFSDIETRLQEAFRSSFGSNIKTDAQSVAGQLIKNFALLFAELNELLEQTVDGFDPHNASGVPLSKLVLLNGIQRIPGTYSQVTLSLTATAACTVPAGSLVTDSAGSSQWSTDSDLTFAGAGTLTVGATCTTLGPIAATASTLTEILTPVFGWDSVSNPAAATLGRSVETDSELRLRRQAVIEGASKTSAGALYRAISGLDGVSSLKLLVNDTESTDSVGIPPQHIAAIISGGDDTTIGQTLFEYIGAGIGTYGSTLVEDTDIDTGLDYSVRFSRPLDVPIHIAMTVEIIDTAKWPADGSDQIKAALLQYFQDFQGVGQDVVFSRLYSPILSVLGHQINSLTIGLSNPPGLTVNIPISAFQIATLALGNISITVV
jgi:uncharacterized phage protein gp47/JayE